MLHSAPYLLLRFLVVLVVLVFLSGALVLMVAAAILVLVLCVLCVLLVELLLLLLLQVQLVMIVVVVMDVPPVVGVFIHPCNLHQSENRPTRHKQRRIACALTHVVPGAEAKPTAIRAPPEQDRQPADQRRRYHRHEAHQRYPCTYKP